MMKKQRNVRTAATTPSIRFFNLIEVALALAISGLAIASIMGVIIAALNANRDTVANHYADLAADELLTFVQATATASNAANWSSTQLLPETKLDGASVETDLNPDGVSPSMSSLYLVDGGANGEYQILLPDDSGSDFAGTCLLWKAEAVSITYWNGGAWANESCTNDDGIKTPGEAGPGQPNGYVAGIHAELSWPVGKPYEARNKKDYYIEIAHPSVAQ